MIKEEKINLGRQIEIDVVKALAIIFMVVIHTYEELSPLDYEVLPNTILDNVIQFLGGPLTAPIFMFALGLGLSYSSHRTPEELMKRGVKIFSLSYIFNVVRFVIPYLLYIASAIGFNQHYMNYECFQIDILTFAGITFLVTGILKKINVPVFGVLAIAILLQVIGSFIATNVTFKSELLIYTLGIFVKTGNPSYFPFFQWYIYPALGLVFAKYLRHIEETDKLYLRVFMACLVMLLIICFTFVLIGNDIRMLYTIAFESFYYQSIIHVLFSVCCVGVEISLVHFVLKVLKITKVPKLIKYLSENLNGIYLVQWTIIAWTELMFFFEETIVPTSLVIPTAILIIFISMAIIMVYNKYIKRKQIVSL